MPIAVRTTQQLRFLQDAAAVVLAGWERADEAGRRDLVQRLRDRSTAALLALETQLVDAEPGARCD